VKSLLASPLPIPGLPIRVATYSVTNSADPSEVRVVLSAEIGDAAESAAEWPVGLLVFDQNDRIFVDSTRYMTLDPASDRTPSPRLLTMTIPLKPGEYTLRLAAMDHDGKAGSVQHLIDARLNRVAGNDVLASDLIISSELGDGGAPRPVPTGVHHSDTMYSILELSGEDAARVSKSAVSVQIAETEAGPTLLSANAQPLPRAPGQRTYAALLQLGVLPPGEYVARAVVSVPGEKDTAITRAFRHAPVEAAAAPAPAEKPASPDDAPPPLPTARIAAPVARFSIEDVLEPTLVHAQLDFLEQTYPVSAANAPIVAQARQGKYAVPAGADKAAGDTVTLAFIRGLGLLEKKQYSQAAGWFQTALKGASDFLGAAVYLGAVHAAAGRDNDAIGAWQMATIGAESDAVYPMLVDAMLRVGDAQGALDMIDEAPDAWPSEHERLRRVATAHAMLGQFEPALQTLTELLEADSKDSDLLFVAIQVLYRQHLARPLDADDRKRFESYAQRYVEGRGADAALVQTWRRFVAQ
jgi:tetratricopeptide (TPR) repeat protein